MLAHLVLFGLTIYAIRALRKEGDRVALWLMFGMFASFVISFGTLGFGHIWIDDVDDQLLVTGVGLFAMAVFITAYIRRVLKSTTQQIEEAYFDDLQERVDALPPIKADNKIFREVIDKATRPRILTNVDGRPTLDEQGEPIVIDGWVKNIEPNGDALVLSTDFTRMKVYVPYPGVSKSGDLYTILHKKGEREQDILTLDDLATSLLIEATAKAKGLL